MKTITVVGGGNSAHVLIPLLSKTGMKINLLTRKPKVWRSNISLDYLLPEGEHIATYQGKIDKISSAPAELIPESDIVILCMPVHAYRQALHSIAEHIDKNKKVFIGTVFGQAGFNWMTREIIDKFSLKNITTFAIGLIPWICRAKEYGKAGIVYGAKPVNVVAIDPKEDFSILDDMLLKKIVPDWFVHGSFKLADNFISLTLSLDNQIIHTARLYGLFLEYGGQWNSKEDVPYFYRDFSEKSAQILENLDKDYSMIRGKIKNAYPEKDFTFMLDYLSLDNTTNLCTNKTIMDTFENSKTLGAIRTPVVLENGKWVIDKSHRFFYDDVFYGLCIAKWIAQKLDLPSVHIDEVLMWAQTVLGESIIENGKLAISSQIKKDIFKYGVPEVYGYTELDDIID